MLIALLVVLFVMLLVSLWGLWNLYVQTLRVNELLASCEQTVQRLHRATMPDDGDEIETEHHS